MRVLPTPLTVQSKESAKPAKPGNHHDEGNVACSSSRVRRTSVRAILRVASSSLTRKFGVPKGTGWPRSNCSSDDGSSVTESTGDDEDVWKLQGSEHDCCRSDTTSAVSSMEEETVTEEATRFGAVFVGLTEEEVIDAAPLLHELGTPYDDGVLVVLPKCQNKGCSQAGCELAHSLRNRNVNVTVLTAESASINTITWPFQIHFAGITAVHEKKQVVSDICTDVVFTSSAVREGGERTRMIAESNCLYTISSAITCVVPKERMTASLFALERLRRKLAWQGKAKTRGYDDDESGLPLKARSRSL